MSVKSIICNWNEDVASVDDVNVIIAHPAYERIRLADRYIEWEKNCFVHTAAFELLRFLRRGEYNPGFFSLLEDITGQQPYNVHEEAAQSWLKWGVEHRYVSANDDVLTQVIRMEGEL